MKIEGLDGVLKRIDDMGDKAPIAQALGKACAVVERAAKENAPKGTGELRRSISSRVAESVGDTLEGYVYTTLEYAPYVEYGTGLFAVNGGREDVPWHYKDDEGNWHTTSGQKPQPFMVPALYDNREKITRILKEGIKV